MKIKDIEDLIEMEMLLRKKSMITCKKCHRFVSNVITNYCSGTAEVKSVKGDCKKCGKQVEVDYDDFEELGIKG